MNNPRFSLFILQHQRQQIRIRHASADICHSVQRKIEIRIKTNHSNMVYGFYIYMIITAIVVTINTCELSERRAFSGVFEHTDNILGSPLTRN